MKILSYNVDNDYRNLEEKSNQIIYLIINENIDIIGLQEVIPKLYDLLYKSNKLSNYIISQQPINVSFFNVLISKHKYDIVYKQFINSNMNRGYLAMDMPNMLLITTHLESASISENTRKLQINEILKYININYKQKYLDKTYIIFGDLNFTNSNETIANFNNIEFLSKNDTSKNDIYTYDSLYNVNAISPYRSNLDRFFYKKTSSNNNIYTCKILNNITLSDHYPILLEVIYSGLPPE